MDDGALKGRPNHGRFGRPFRALTTNGGQPRALPWAIFGRPVGALAMNLLWVVEHMRDLKERRWSAYQPVNYLSKTPYQTTSDIGHRTSDIGH
jgi:hypothetical protein